MVVIFLLHLFYNLLHFLKILKKCISSKIIYLFNCNLLDKSYIMSTYKIFTIVYIMFISIIYT